MEIFWVQNGIQNMHKSNKKSSKESLNTTQISFCLYFIQSWSYLITFGQFITLHMIQECILFFNIHYFDLAQSKIKNVLQLPPFKFLMKQRKTGNPYIVQIFYYQPMHKYPVVTACDRICLYFLLSRISNFNYSPCLCWI